MYVGYFGIFYSCFSSSLPSFLFFMYSSLKITKTKRRLAARMRGSIGRVLRAWRAVPWNTGGGTRRRLALSGGVAASVAASFAVAHNSSDCQRRPTSYFQPGQPYPEWDLDWDGRGPSLGHERPQPSGPIRHIILVRHGQYDEREREDSQRVLTPLGREQAAATGDRLAAIAAATKGRVRLHTSTMTRSRQTAAIIREKMGTGALLALLVYGTR